MRPATLSAGSFETQAYYLRRFLFWFIPVLLGFGAVFFGLGLALATTNLAWSGLVILGYGLTLPLALRLAGGKHELPALLITCLGMLLATALIVPLMPPLFPTLALVPFIAAGLILPYSDQPRLAKLIALCCLVAVINLALGQVLTQRGDRPSSLTISLAISSFGAAAFFLTFLLWQFCSRLRESLEKSLAANQALQEAQALERQLYEHQKWESLGVLAGGIAHDFNNRLTPIIGYIALARMELSPESDIWHGLGEAEQAALSAAELTQQMLAYVGRGHMELGPVNLNHVLNQVRPLAGAGRPAEHIRYTLMPSLPPIWGDEAQLGQVALNLLTNAVEALSDQGQIWVSTSYHEQAPPPLGLSYRFLEGRARGVVCLEVRDSGSGMDPATLARVCEPFFSTKFSGRGLGMAAVLGIVRSHKGALEAESTPGVGSRFRVLLPEMAREEQRRDVTVITGNRARLTDGGT